MSIRPTVTPEDRVAAHMPALRNWCGFGRHADEHSEDCTAIAQALANAREAGRREAFGEALTAIRDGRFDAPGSIAEDVHNGTLAWADRAIRAARDRALAEYGKAQLTGEGAA